MRMVRLYMQALLLSLQALWRALRTRLPTPSPAPPPPPAPMKPPFALDTEDTRMAVHEAGHALVAWRCTAVTAVHRATLQAAHGGLVSYDFINDPAPDYLWCRLVIMLAGIAGELAVFPSARSGPAEKDLQDARRICRMLASRSVAPPWPSTVAVAAPPFERLFRRPLPPAERSVLRQGYTKARQLLHDYKQAHTKVTALLLHQRTVHEPVLAQHLGSRTWTRALGAMKATFIHGRA